MDFLFFFRENMGMQRESEKKWFVLVGEMRRTRHIMCNNKSI